MISGLINARRTIFRGLICSIEAEAESVRLKQQVHSGYVDEFDLQPQAIRFASHCDASVQSQIEANAIPVSVVVQKGRGRCSLSEPTT